MPYNYNNYNRPKKSNRNNRPDHQKGHRMEFERNRKKVLASEDICAICGQRVDKKLKYPHPMSATVDHVIPVSKGGHPSDISNLQLAHFYCNRQKSDKLIDNAPAQEEQTIDNRNLPLFINWALYEEDNQPLLSQLRAEVEQLEATGRHLYADGIR